MDGIELEFDDEAFRAIAHLAVERETGARGLRSILESIMLEPMYSLPSEPDVKKIIITAEFVKGEAPLTVIKNTPELPSSN